MAECDHHPKYEHDPNSSILSLQCKQQLNLQDELVWGLSYRNLKKQQANVPMPSKRSPMDIPFKICREKQRKTKQHKKVAGPGAKKSSKHKAKWEKPTLLEISVMSQRQYMEHLAIPKQAIPTKQIKKKKCQCYIEPCPPRVVQLALPKKRRVYHNWKDYQGFLSTPMILKLQQILHTDKNLDPKEARYYYKQLDKKKWKLAKEKRRLRRKAKAEKEKGNNVWLMEEIKETSLTLVDYLKHEPLFSLTYKQLMLSDGILDYIVSCGSMENRPSRNTENHQKKTVIEVSDKVAVWMDTLTRFVDLQAFDSAEDIAPLTISSMEGEEGETETEGYSDEDRLRGLWGEGLYGEEGMGEGGEFGDLSGRSPTDREQMMSDLFRPHEGEGESDIDAFLDELDLDLLDKLIKILSNCSDEFLEGMVNEDRMPGVRYIDILNRVKELRDGLLSRGKQKPFLEQLMLDWAIQNEPDEVDDKMKNKIQETAALLGDFLFAGAGGRPKFPAIYEGEGGEDGMGGQLGEGEDGMGGESGEGGPVIEEGIIKEGMGLLGEGIDGGEGTDGGEGGEGDGEGGTLGDVTGGGLSEMGEGGEDGGLDEDKLLTGLEGEGGTPYDMSQKEKEDMLLAGLEREGYEEGLLELGEGEGEFAVLYEAGLEGRIIKGHKPSVILEHRPDMVCCLSLKIWTVWLLDITHNAHNWTKWLHCIIQKVKEFASIVRGDVLLPNGEKKVLYKEDWRKFAKETEEMIIAWRQYSAHVKDLSDSIIESFHGKKVLNCCPKCLQDHLIKDVVTAHETLEALTEAINCATYWQRCLDELVQKTCPVAGMEFETEVESSSTSSEESDVSEPCICRKRKTKRRPQKGEPESSESSVYEIEEIDMDNYQRQGGPGPSQRGAGPNQGRGGPGPSRGGPGAGGCTRRY